MSTWSGNLRSSRTTSSLRNRSSNIAESNDGLSPTSPRQRRENQEKELHGEYRVELGARIILLLNASVKNRSDAAQRNETVSDDELSKLLSMSVEGFGLLQHSSEILEHISVDTGRDSSRSMKTTTTLPPIQVKVEDSTCSPSTSYAEPQPSVATPVSASGPFTSHTPSVTTPRGSVAAGMESNVEKAAKQEAQVLSRIAELRRQGLWSQTRLPIIEMPPRNKTHWDYLLEEMRWMSVDFKQERHFKRHAAKKFATQISRLVRDKELENERSEQRAVKDAKRICALIAKAVRDFWLNVEKVVDFRKQEVIEAMKRRALDQQLEIIVGHADKLSEMVQKGLAEDKLSQNTHEERDDEYEYEELDSDDESSLIKEEEKTKGDWKEEVSELTKQGTLEFNDFMDMLPPGYLDQYKEPEDTAILQTSRSKRKHESLNCSDSENELSLDENNSVDPVRKKRRLNYDEPSTSRDHSINMSIERGGRLGAGEVIKSVASDEALPKEDKNIMEINFGRLALESSEERQKELTNIAEEALKLQPKGFTLETTHVKTEIPHLIRGVLREYQLVGLDWLVTLYEKGLNGILADEMGLGKTIQTIALLAHLACKDNNWGPHLIVVPTSVILNWEVELKKWCPAFKILTYFGSQKERVEKRKGWSKANAFHVCITSYKVITQDIRAFKQKAWQYFVLDEAQNIKNFKSQRWQMLLNVRSRRRLLLTGTPLQNSLMELWSLMHFLMPAIFASHNDFKDWFNNPLTDMMEGNTEWNSAIVLRLHKVLRPFILRRLKSDVERQLPEKSEQIIICPLSKRQRYLYDDFMSQKTTKENLRSGNVMSVLNIVMQLRKCCNHPNLFEARPILSPLALRPLNIVLPGLLMDFCNNGMKVDPPNIPDSLLFGRRAYESHFTLNERRRLVVYRSYMEEIREQKEIIPMPSRKEFKFNCQQPEKHRFFSQLLPQKAASLSSSHQISEGEILGKPEYYVSMDESGDCARVYEVLTNSAGERIMRECDPTTFASGNAPILLKNRTSQMPSQEGLRTSNASQLVAEMNERKKNVNADDRDVASASSNLTSSSRFSINPAFRTRTVSNRNVPRSGNFIRETDSMTSNGSVMMDDDVFVAKSARIDANIPKVNSVEVNASNVSNHPSVGDKFISYRNTSKKNDDSLFTRNSSELRAALNYEKNARCDRLAHINFQRIFKENALIPFELLYILTNKFCSQGKSKKFDEELEIISYLKEIPKRLNLWLEEVMERFMIYVHAAVTDPPTLVCSSSGMSSYLNDLRKSSEEKCRTAFIKRSNLASHNAFISQKLQFPELRLIEYDCGKLQILNQLLRDLFLYKHRCLIFTQMSRMLDVLQAFLSFHGYQYFRLDGSTGIEQRQALMERFNADPKIFCFILSTRSGGIGVNLTGADTVIFYDSDWNPTMDAQAQDRCHRIGQTRNVTIYRLISERTIEENILKKAMQKRRLGELAIDEAGFTPEYFKGDNIRDLFKNDTSLSDVMPVSVADKAELEKAMATFEDAQDVVAAKRANAEAKAELAEFDEGQIPDTNLDKSDSRYYEVFNQLKPIERYAIKFLEAEYKPDLEEEVKEAEAMLASKKNEWLKAQNEVVVEDVSASDDEFGLTYPNELVISGISDELLCLDYSDEQMPIWMPPSPPKCDMDDDLFFDQSADYWYSREPMNETELPSVIHDLPRVKTTIIGSSSNVQSSIPESFSNDILLTTGQQHPSLLAGADLPVYGTEPTSASISFVVEDMQKANTQLSGFSSGLNVANTPNLLRPTTPSRIPSNFKNAPETGKKTVTKSSHGRSLCGRSEQRKNELRRPFTPPAVMNEALDNEGQEWSLTEDYLMLKFITEEQRIPHHLYSPKVGQVVCWKILSSLLRNKCRSFRSPRMCSMHYQTNVQTREDRLMFVLDPVTKKTRKVALSGAEIAHLRANRHSTAAQFNEDSKKKFSAYFQHEFNAAKSVYPKVIFGLESESVRTDNLGHFIYKLFDLSERKQRDYLADFVGNNELDICKIRREKRLGGEEKGAAENRRNIDARRKDDDARKYFKDAKEELGKKDNIISEKRGSIFPGTHASVVNSSADRFHSSSTSSNITQTVTHIPIAGVRNLGNLPQTSVISSSINAGESAILHNQRAFSDHQSLASLPPQHHANARRISNPHQILVSTGSQIAQTVMQQPYVMVSADALQLTSGNQQIGTRVQYRQEGGNDRQPFYRTLSSTGVRRTTSAASIQRLGYGNSQQTGQLYATGNHSGRTIIVPPNSDVQNLGNEVGQLQVVRPQQSAMQSNQRIDYRPRPQKGPSRLFLTPAGSGVERAYIMPQSQMRMLPSGQRIQQRRTTASIQANPLNVQQQVMMVPGKSGNVQQIRTISRNIQSYQGNRIPSIGLLMNPSGRNSGDTTIGLSGTTRHVPVIDQSSLSIGNEIQPQHITLPPITLSSHHSQPSQVSHSSLTEQLNSAAETQTQASVQSSVVVTSSFS